MPTVDIDYVLWPIIIILSLGVLVSLLAVVYPSLSNEKRMIFSRKRGVSSDTVCILSRDKAYLSLKGLKILLEVASIVFIGRFLNLIGDFGLAAKVGIDFCVILIFFESIPRVFINFLRIGSVDFATRFIKGIVLLFSPLVSLYLSLNIIFGGVPHHCSEQEGEGQNNDSFIDMDNEEFVRGVNRFENSEVSEIMTPKVAIISVDINSSFQHIKELIKSSGYSRLPVYDADIDNIKGVLYIKDIITHIDEKDFDWRNVIREPYYVLEGKLINELLQEFQNQRVHMAIVVDDYGSTQGLITLEDILEELVGEISDESESEQKLYMKISSNEYIFDGKTYISDFEKILSLSDDYFDEQKGDAESLAGIMLEVKGGFPSINEKLTIREFEFTALALSNRRIEKIKITSKEPIANEN